MKLILLIASLLACLNVHAQLARGNWQAGGYINLSSNSDKYSGSSTSAETKITSFSFSPDVGTFITDNVVLGGNISCTWSTEKYSEMDGNLDESNYKNRENIFTVGPFVRLYKSIGQSSALFLHGNINAGFGNTEQTLISGEKIDSKISVVNLAIRPGFIFFLSTRFGIQGSFGALSYDKTKKTRDGGRFPDSTMTTEDLNLNLNLSSFTFGAQYFIAR